ncbi:MAG TPA: DUF3854 domain-containing protein [Thermoanaerobaculia bacterium]|nr:DUF3854 domain-containing protein [Thermoanaerobaculia bacterium]
MAPHHRTQLEASAIKQEVWEARGVFSVVDADAARTLGFSQAQSRVPALVFPLFDPTGRASGHQLRPDAPRLRDGKPAKYESLPGRAPVLDVNPLCTARLADPANRLWITEGVKKGDALVSAGEVAMAINGVYGWRGKNGYGGVAALPDWENVPLNGRDVILVFDSDLSTNRNVATALMRLAAFLRSRGASVRTVYLPAGADGAKVGVDDYLAAGGALDALLSEPAPTEEHRELIVFENDDAEPAHPFKVTPNGIVMMKPTKNGGVVEILLTNFTAEIVEDVELDDGVESTRHYRIRAVVGGRERTVSVPAHEYHSLGWIPTKLGARAIVSPGLAAQDCTRAAIQSLSTDSRERTVFAHLGWRERDGELFYLHAGGAITAEGLRTDVDVEVPGGLERYALPDPESVDLAASFAAVRRLLETLGAVRGWRLLSLVPAAILGEIVPTDFVAWVWGRTGTFKSTAAALVSCFFGKFDRLSLPGNFTSTANATQGIAHAAKDVVFVVDDFAPAANQSLQSVQDQTVFKLIRAVGDRHGRNRMRPDRTLVGGKPPRGLVLVTAELPQPAGQSTQARVFEIPWDNVGINNEALAWAQQEALLYAGVTAAFVKDVASRFAVLREELPRRVEALRSEFVASHRRVAETASKLVAAVEVFLDFAHRSGLVSEAEKASLRGAAVEAIAEAARGSSEAEMERSPITLLLEGLRAAFSLGQAYLDHVVGGPPLVDREKWGRVHGEPGPQSALIGWRDENRGLVYLVPSAALLAASRALGGDIALPRSVAAVGALLRAERLLHHAEPGRSTILMRIGQTRPRVWTLREDHFVPKDEPEEAQPSPAWDIASVPLPDDDLVLEVEPAKAKRKKPVAKPPAAPAAAVPPTTVPPVTADGQTKTAATPAADAPPVLEVPETPTDAKSEGVPDDRKER